MNERPIDCVIHTDPSVLAVWDSAVPWRENSVLLVEIATTSVLAGDFSSGVEAIAHGAPPASLVTTRGGRDMLLASNRVQHPAAVLAGLRRLNRGAGPWRRIIALVHVDDVDRFPSLFGDIARVCVAWDRTCAPTESLTRVPDVLDAEGALRPDVWCGFHVYDPPDATPSASRTRLFADVAR